MIAKPNYTQGEKKVKRYRSSTSPTWRTLEGISVVVIASASYEPSTWLATSAHLEPLCIPPFPSPTTTGSGAFARRSLYQIPPFLLAFYNLVAHSLALLPSEWYQIWVGPEYTWRSCASGILWPSPGGTIETNSSVWHSNFIRGQRIEHFSARCCLVLSMWLHRTFVSDQCRIDCLEGCTNLFHLHSLCFTDWR